MDSTENDAADTNEVSAAVTDTMAAPESVAGADERTTVNEASAGDATHGDELSGTDLAVAPLRTGDDEDTAASTSDVKETVAIKEDPQVVMIRNLHEKIRNAFSLFDEENNNQVDVREVGTVVRSLKCCPTEGELQDLLAEIDQGDLEPSGSVQFDAFLPLMTKVLMENRYRPMHEDTILAAFKVLDLEDKGFLTAEQLQKFMTEEGEPLNADEMDEMLSASRDPETGNILYKDFVSALIVEDN